MWHRAGANAKLIDLIIVLKYKTSIILTWKLVETLHVNHEIFLSTFVAGLLVRSPTGKISKRAKVPGEVTFAVVIPFRFTPVSLMVLSLEQYRRFPYKWDWTLSLSNRLEYLRATWRQLDLLEFLEEVLPLIQGFETWGGINPKRVVKVTCELWVPGSLSCWHTWRSSELFGSNCECGC